MSASRFSTGAHHLLCAWCSEMQVQATTNFATFSYDQASGWTSRGSGFGSRHGTRICSAAPSPPVRVITYLQHRDAFFIFSPLPQTKGRTYKSNAKFILLQQKLQASLLVFGCEWSRTVDSCCSGVCEHELSRVLFFP